MIEIYPSLTQFKNKCPDCGCQLSDGNKLFFQGANILADILCTCCGVSYFQTYPVGHAALFPVSFTKSGTKQLFAQDAKEWLAKPLIGSITENKWDAFGIECDINKRSDNIIILNCLDDCWGHVLQKLLNAEKYLTLPDTGLVILLPKIFKWLVPEGVAEVWSVKAPLNKLKWGVENLDKWIQERIKSYSKVYLSEANIQPNILEVSIDKFVKVKPFNLNKFSANPYQVTFIIREDRFWHNYVWEEKLFLASIKFKFFPIVKPFFLSVQAAKINSLVKKVRRDLPRVQFNLIGIGKEGTFNTLKDLRTITPDESSEMEWCNIYSQSHLVIGVHGSNMLLPTALAAAFIELVPSWKIDRWGEDILQNYSDRKSHYLGRFLNGNSASILVAKHIISILKNFKHFQNVLGQ